MIVLRFTQSLLKDMKSAQIQVDDISPLFSWHVNIYKLNNKKHILFVNDLSRLCLIIDGIRSSQLSLLKEKFLITLETYLQEEEIEKNMIDRYLKEGSELSISKTNNRSVLSTMTEISIFETDNFTDNMQRMKWLNRLIYKPIEYNEPIKVFKEALKTLSK
ncbi:hypothetical protein PAT3040_02172 [Paenibacillus agaridevorans]|uniref:DUF6933 domain-containing protein n=1 Tax=Paenibacillus agaridevorans TaxID=171404 RepID=A0A2R5ELS4_9BACL|nr:hypothetical protein [Paenibacillus agaridevorans]GBG07616.1 hypothetical protein PAT3040_02172 [Paenibacillus agaridevorans]